MAGSLSPPELLTRRGRRERTSPRPPIRAVVAYRSGEVRGLLSAPEVDGLDILGGYMLAQVTRDIAPMETAVSSTR